ncbi:hypothetical protein [Dokdonella sp.]|uniref:hypothetical protein n=1 Tax=Dokdonella sp. TaxID=2291710 RepID=UPI001B240F92|nr:hypothetical protein [Dokdonella sp.]MBO9662664.1 hypothetical protein [Dokdonella sp.]
MRVSPYLAAVATIASGSVFAAGEFIPLDTADGQATQFSQNGQYLAISTGDAGGARWIRASGVEEPITGMNYLNGINNLGAISGSLIAGGGTDAPALSPLGAGAPTALPLPVDLQNAGVDDVADDGSAVGLAWMSDWSVARAYYYSAADGAVTPLPVASPEAPSRASSISADGHVIAGWNDEPASGFRRGVVWKDGVATYPVVTLDGGEYNVGEGAAVSGNGRWVVGHFHPRDKSSGSWRLDVETGEVVEIPSMPFAFGVSDDGRTVVGSGSYFLYPPRAPYVWTEAGGTELLTDYLAARAIAYPSDWGFEGGLTAVSGDGLAVAGWTRTSPSGMRSFVVTGIDAPVDAVFDNGFDGAPASNPVADPGFEGSINGDGPWTSTSSVRGSAICAVVFCGDGLGTAGPHRGPIWAWLGGVEGSAEESTVSQRLRIPSGAPRYLNFWLWIGLVNGSDSMMTVRIDGVEVASYPEPANAEDGYTQRSVDIGAYADGAEHTIQFRYTESAGRISNYGLDDVTIDAEPAP